MPNTAKLASNASLTLFRVAHQDDFYFGPEGTQADGMPRCFSWEISHCSFLDIPEFKEGRMFAFTQEQMLSVLSIQNIRSMEKEGFVVYAFEATGYEIHEDQVTFDADSISKPSLITAVAA